MASFSQQMSKALKLIDGKKVNAAARGGLKKNRKKFVIDFGNAIKRETGLRRSLADIAKRMFFVFSRPKTFLDKSVDRIEIDNTQFSFLNFPGKLRRNKNKDGSDSKRLTLEGINAGKGFRSYEGVFVQRLGGNLLPLRGSKSSNKLKSMQVNAYNIVANNPDKFKEATNAYTDAVMIEMGKRMIRAMHRQVNKKVKFKLSKG